MKLSILALLLLTVGCASAPKAQVAPPPPASPTLPQTLEAAVNSDFRTPSNKARDVYRHPVETLTFFGLKPEMTVVEIVPASGWYTEILAPYLSSHGQYIAADNFAPTGDHGGLRKEFADFLQKYPQVGEHIRKTEFHPPDKLAIAEPGSADMVLTFRNVHNWEGKHASQAAFQAFFKALKPGGILGVVEHRAAAHGKVDENSGYMKESTILKLAQKAGFKLVAKSEINANPKDTKDYPGGVWTLPPNYRAKGMSDQDRDKYTAIGESDRMTLKFMKPAK